MPSPKQKPESPQEILTNLLSEVQRYTSVVDLDAVKARLAKDIAGLKSDLADQTKRFSDIIAQIKAKQGELKHMDTSIRAEIEHQHDQRRKELGREYDKEVHALSILRGDVKKASAQLTDIQSKVAETHKVNLELIQSNQEQSDLYEELAGKVNSFRDTQEEFERLIAEQRALAKDAEASTTAARATQARVINTLDAEMAAYQERQDNEKKVLEGEIGELRSQLDAYKKVIVQTKEDEAQRAKNLRDAEQTVAIQRAALKRDQEEFSIKKRKFFAGQQL